LALTVERRREERAVQRMRGMQGTWEEYGRVKMVRGERMGQEIVWMWVGVGVRRTFAGKRSARFCGFRCVCVCVCVCVSE
jgi:hypothetical protein